MAHKISKRKSPRRGSLQYAPRKRAKKPYPIVKNWKGDGILGFAGYKAGMTHVIAVDNRKNSPTKGEEISIPVTIIEAPPLKVLGIRYYKDKNPAGEKWSEKIDKNFSRKIKTPKKPSQSKVEEHDLVRLIIGTQPTFKKTPEIFEMGYEGGNPEELLGKEIAVEDVFKPGDVVDAIAVTKGKGFQGVIKKFGAKLLHHKSEKKRRKAGSMGPWHPAKVSFRALMPGRIGFHQRTEFNKWIIKMGEGNEVNPRGGFINYGLVSSRYVMLHGSVPGPKKRLIIMRKAIRRNNLPGIAPEIRHISLKSKQGVGA